MEERWNQHQSREPLKKEKIFWIGSSRIPAFPSSCTLSHLHPVQNTRHRDGLQNKRKIQAAQYEDCLPEITRESMCMSRKKNETQFTVQGASCTLQERPKSQERSLSSATGNMRRGQIVWTQDFQPLHKNVLQMTKGMLGSNVRGYSRPCAEDAESPVDMYQINKEKPRTTTLHLYLPKAESQEEEPVDTARSVNYVLEDIPLKDPVEICPSRQNLSRQAKRKATYLTVKETLPTCNLSVHYGGNYKWATSLSSRIHALLDDRNKKDQVMQSIQKAAHNVGYRLGSYYQDKTADSSEYGLEVKALRDTHTTSVI
ncbi:uncharacterized protein LOC128503276 isoform X2 [Spea bombifrons]|uniref:uncharacterized protein LOC128503276 isoform X2 n=1 Tax=Spea bombifrons TaxID=233779 RepID=UPI00234A3235|nr:uncharacterized protein LOC128503276 isoform X2 [Spea bombifrons]